MKDLPGMQVGICDQVPFRQTIVASTSAISCFGAHSTFSRSPCKASCEGIWLTTCPSLISGMRQPPKF